MKKITTIPLGFSVSESKKFQKSYLRQLCESEEGKELLKTAVMQAIDKSYKTAIELKDDYSKLLGGYMPGWLNDLFKRAIAIQKQQMSESDMPKRVYDIYDEGEEDSWRHGRPPVFENRRELDMNPDRSGTKRRKKNGEIN